MSRPPPLDDTDEEALQGLRNERTFGVELDAKYEFVRPLGRGGMGEVVLARHRSLDDFVAIKLLHPQLLGAEAVSRFVREARATARIRSEHVVRVRDAGVLGSGAPYIIMEYLRGLDLAALIAQQGPLTVPKAVDFMLQALDAIAEAHALGIIHRDLKPGNLFAARDRDGNQLIKVVDFGLAKRTIGIDSVDHVITQPGTLVGSPSYMSPEQLIDAEDVDARTDVWALGACLFELLTGDPPFRSASMPQLYTAIVHGRIPQVGDRVAALPPGLEKVVATCLCRRPGDRFKDAGELLAALAPFGALQAPPSPSVQTLPSATPSSLPPDTHISLDAVSSSWRDPREKLRSLGVVRSYSRRLALLAAIVALTIAAALSFSRREASRREAATANVPPRLPLLPRAHQSPPAMEQIVPSAMADLAPRASAGQPEKPRSKAALDPRTASAPSAAPPASAPSSIYDRYP